MTFDELLSKPILADSDFESYVKALYDEWQSGRKGGAFPTADALGTYIKGIRRDMPPQFFTGNLDSPVVVLSLNPHADGKGSAKEVLHEPFCTTWEDYWSYWQHFAHERYADSGRVKAFYGNKVPSSRFDDRRLRFFAAAAGVKIDRDMRERQNWLGMDLIPLNSPAFALRQVDGYIGRYIRRMVDVLFLHERKLVIILNGKVCGLLQKSSGTDFIVGKPEKNAFKVKKTDGTDCARNCSVERFAIRHKDGRRLAIVTATSFARQDLNGVPLENYGRRVFTDSERQTVKELLLK